MCFIHQKLRTAPPRDGVSAFAVGKMEPAIVDIATAIGTALRYTGTADIDLKYDSQLKRFVVLEINPRVGMCNGLAAACNRNIVYDLYRDACGLPPAEESNRAFAQRYYLSVFDDAYGRWKDGESVAAIGCDLLTTLPRMPTGAVFSFSDPLPACAWFARMSQSVASSMIRKASKRQANGPSATQAPAIASASNDIA
jgi:predicted ATP-grasp superfamily ATP-dependent carboligase